MLQQAQMVKAQIIGQAMWSRIMECGCLQIRWLIAAKAIKILFMPVVPLLVELENITKAVISGLARVRASVTWLAGTVLTGRSGVACRPIKKLLGGLLRGTPLDIALNI